MGRKKKPAKNLSTEEAVKRLFPTKAVRGMKKEAHRHDDDGNGKTRKTPRKKS